MVVKTYCARRDHRGCGLLVHVEDGRIVRIEGDLDSPFNRGTIYPLKGYSLPGLQRGSRIKDRAARKENKRGIRA